MEKISWLLEEQVKYNETSYCYTTENIIETPPPKKSVQIILREQIIPQSDSSKNLLYKNKGDIQGLGVGIPQGWFI